MKRNLDSLSSSNCDDDKCPICLEKLKDTNLAITPCGHKFCFTCLNEHSCRSQDCPMCRADIQTNKIRKIMYNDIFNSAVHTMNNSTPTLIRLIEDIKHKFLILFADHKVDNSPLKDDEEINDLREKEGGNAPPSIVTSKIIQGSRKSSPNHNHCQNLSHQKTQRLSV